MSKGNDEPPFFLKGRLGHMFVIPFFVQVGVTGLVDEMVSSWATLIFAQLGVFATSFFTGAFKHGPLRSILTGFWPAMAFVALRAYDRMDIYSPQRPMERLAGHEFWLAAYAALTLVVAAGGWAAGHSMLKEAWNGEYE